MTRGLILALQFLTRLPVPAIRDFQPGELGASALWFPVVGVVVGSLVGAAVFAGAYIDPWLGALLGVLVWVGVTGALHLDGLADLADALGASHRDSARFLAVLRDPHVGAFGVIALILAIISKWVLLATLVRNWWEPNLLLALALIGAWARYGAIVWSAWLPPLAPGSAERFSWRRSPFSVVGWGVALVSASLLIAPAVLLAPVAIWSWGAWLKARLGGMTGDCLGAGVEVVEAATLLALVLGASL